jgi:hypothetical protein
MDAERRRGGAARWLARAGVVATAACLAFVAQRLAAHVHELPPLAWRWRAVLAVAAATALLVGNAALHAFSWRTLMRGLDPRVGWRESFSVCGRSQLAKYLPGNALHLVQQVVLSRSDRVGTSGAALVTVVDTLAVAAAAALVGAPALDRALALLAASVGTRGTVLVAAAVVAAGAVLLAARLRALPGPLLGVLRPRRVAAAVLLDVVPFLSAGLAVWLLLHGVWPGAAALAWHEVVPGFALAFLLGYVTPGSPGGIGVREAVLYGLYAPALGGSLAAGLFVLARLVFVLGDAATFAVAVGVHRSAPR